MSIVRSTIALLVAIAGVVLVVPGASAQEGYAIGGGTSLPAGARLPLVPGQAVPDFASVVIQNLGGRPADIEFVALGAPADLAVTASASSFRLAPDQSRELALSVAAGARVAPGSYPVTVQFRQTDNPGPAHGGVSYTPGFELKFVADVTNEAGDAVIAAVIAGTTVPVAGELSVTTGNGDGIVFARTSGDGLRTRLAVGDYLARFDLPERTSATAAFTVTAGQQTVVSIPVEAVGFLRAEARPDRDDGTPNLVELSATVKNSLPAIPGPVRARVRIDRDGAGLGTVLLETFTELPAGLTGTARQLWAPADGWQAGTYTFTFTLEVPGYTVSAPSPPTIVVPWWTWPKLLAAAAIAGLILAGIGWWAYRRRNMIT